MKYECGIIVDLLSIYQDGACSEETKNAVEEHLAECESCRQLSRELDAAENDPAAKLKAEYGRIKAGSLKSAGRKYRRVKIAVWVTVIIIALTVAAYSTVGVMKKTLVQVGLEKHFITLIPFDYVLFSSDCKIAELEQKLVTVRAGDTVDQILVVCAKETLWDKLTVRTDHKHLFFTWEADLLAGSSEVKKIYYYIGDFDLLEDEMSYYDFNGVIDRQSKLISRRTP